MIQRDYRKVGEIYFLTATYREDFSNIDSVQIPKGTPVQIIDTSNFPEIKVRDAYDSEVSIDIDFLSRDPIASLYAYKMEVRKLKRQQKARKILLSILTPLAILFTVALCVWMDLTLSIYSPIDVSVNGCVTVFTVLIVFIVITVVSVGGLFAWDPEVPEEYSDQHVKEMARLWSLSKQKH